MKRRDFLQHTAAGAAALTAGPLFLNAGDKAGGKKPVVGKGVYRYECTHDWGQLPAHLRWETTHGVCLDEEGLVYVKHQGHGRRCWPASRRAPATAPASPRRN